MSLPNNFPAHSPFPNHLIICLSISPAPSIIHKTPATPSIQTILPQNIITAQRTTTQGASIHPLPQTTHTSPKVTNQATIKSQCSNYEWLVLPLVSLNLPETHYQPTHEYTITVSSTTSTTPLSTLLPAAPRTSLTASIKGAVSPYRRDNTSRHFCT